MKNMNWNFITGNGIKITQDISQGQKTSYGAIIITALAKVASGRRRKC